MKTRLLKECYWILGVIGITIITGVLIFDERLFSSDFIDVQIYDTYYVFPKSFFTLIIFLLLVITAITIRVINARLKSRVMAVVIALFLMVIVGQLMYFLYQVNEEENHHQKLISFFGDEIKNRYQHEWSSPYSQMKIVFSILIFITGVVFAAVVNKIRGLGVWAKMINK
jgi:hypothetical protein